MAVDLVRLEQRRADLTELINAPELTLLTSDRLSLAPAFLSMSLAVAAGAAEQLTVARMHARCFATALFARAHVQSSLMSLCAQVDDGSFNVAQRP